MTPRSPLKLNPCSGKQWKKPAPPISWYRPLPTRANTADSARRITSRCRPRSENGSNQAASRALRASATCAARWVKCTGNLVYLRRTTTRNPIGRGSILGHNRECEPISLGARRLLQLTGENSLRLTTFDEIHHL